MNFKLFAGGLFAWGYNDFIGQIPSRSLRSAYLKMWLGGLGEKTGVQSRCRFLNGRKIFLGDHNVINFGCLLDGRKYAITTGSNVSIGPEASVLTLGHDPRSPDFSDLGGPVLIKDYVWVGYRAIVLPGISLGTGAVVGAGAVVTRNVDPWTIVAGNPAKPIGQRPEVNYELNFRPWLL